jgi:hypothetical protein
MGAGSLWPWTRDARWCKPLTQDEKRDEKEGGPVDKDEKERVFITL